MQAREFKTRIYNELSTVGKALANSRRLEIIELLAQGPSSVEYIAEQTGLSIANASQHLQTLKNARLVTSEKKGKFQFYSLSNSKVFEVWKSMWELGFSQNAQIEKLVQRYRKSRHNLESVTSSQLLERIQQGKALALDVRPREEYETGHIASAVSAPQEELIQLLKSLPENKEIVAYCRGPLCELADDAVQQLQKHGFQASRLDIGYPEWESAGLPVET